MIGREGRGDLPVGSKSKVRRREREVRGGGRLIGCRGNSRRRGIIQDDKRRIGDCGGELATPGVDKGGVPCRVMRIEVTKHERVVISVVED